MTSYRIWMIGACLPLLPAATSVAAPVEVFIPGQNPAAATAGCAVYAQPYRKDPTFVGRTSDQGALADRFDNVEEPGRLVQRAYWVLPHDPDRWSLHVASEKSLPSTADAPSDDVLRHIGKRVEAHWDEANGQPSVTTDPVPERGTVRIQTQGADGRPLADRAVHLYPADRFGGFGRESLMLSGRTDARGVIEIRQFPGVAEWIVCFPGLGHTQTGPIVVTPGGESTITLHRPAPYAAISGRLSDELRDQTDGESPIVLLATDLAWQYRQAPFDAEGRFRLADVPIGSNYELRIKGVKTKTIGMRGLHPGEQRSGVAVEPRENPSAEWKLITQQWNDRQRKVHDWKPTLRGRVVDHEGRAVEGAEVFATIKYHGGTRMGQITKSATTNAAGMYAIPDARGNVSSIALIAHVAGRPLAIGRGGFAGDDGLDWSGVGFGSFLSSVSREELDDLPLPQVLHQADLVIPERQQGGELRVTIYQDARPSEGAGVALESVDYQPTFSPMWALGNVPRELQELLTPSARTDAHGVAVFSGLTPGLYSVTTFTWSDASDRIPPIYGVDRSWSSFADHVAIRSGVSTVASLNRTKTKLEYPPIRVFDTSGEWLSNIKVNTSWTRPASRGGARSTIEIDEQGVGRVHIGGLGMRRLEVRYLSPSQDSVTSPMPFHQSREGARKVALSRLMPREQAVVFRPRKLEAATLQVEVTDQDGRPAKGAAAVEVRYDVREVAALDSQGAARFERMRPGRVTVGAIVAGAAAPPARLDATDEELTDQWMIPVKSLELAADEQASVQLRVQPVAYIRGRISPLPPKNASMRLSTSNYAARSSLDTKCWFNHQTGEFIIGPVLPGRIEAQVHLSRDNAPLAYAKHTFHVDRQGVHREDFPLELTTIKNSTPSAPPLEGRVYRADGKTPAYAARIAAYTPNQPRSPYSRWRPADTWTNAAGRFIARKPTLWRKQYSDLKLPPGTPTEPVLVAWLPGELGATITPLPSPPAEGEELRIVLPEPAGVRGAVTVGGESPLGMPAAITVLAQHRGRGRLDEVLSVRTTANADGAYELPGLTPGEYDVQAAVDGIWLSSTTRVSVPAGGPWSHTLDIDVPPLGDAAEYRLIDAAGTPLANQSIRLAIPEFDGPLGSTLRSPEMSTDTGGVVHVEGLRAGEHEFELGTDGARYRFEVPPLGSPTPIPVDLRVHE
ncbi:hypothetical protein KOR34_50640 [Posidoniimonas corsicana]|uniref:Nickel uptake substrate-specific transmembrane region n=1 Tax=Posidoniimonas corsicana TaxID=1938618 RepID=A0A5C5UU12_9BACT|nr:carboxypeptidase-like regulatory domain-containing protein [Posidoniimonas corsicana]TWT29746.1 hypothetical protein KOR34_50640 [Posidoniimonas corsicana]